MKTLNKNFAFIDTQNTHRGIQSLGWKMDWRRLRVYLSEKYGVKTAYLFMGYLHKHTNLYDKLQKIGFNIIFKPVIFDSLGKAKGNCDADLVLHTIIKKEHYDKAVILSSDGDFYSLVRYLYRNNKLEIVLSPYIKTCSHLLKKEAKEKINYMNNLAHKIGLKNEKAPHKDETL